MSKATACCVQWLSFIPLLHMPQHCAVHLYLLYTVQLSFHLSLHHAVQTHTQPTPHSALCNTALCCTSPFPVHTKPRIRCARTLCCTCVDPVQTTSHGAGHDLDRCIASCPQPKTFVSYTSAVAMNCCCACDILEERLCLEQLAQCPKSQHALYFAFQAGHKIMSPQNHPVPRCTVLDALHHCLRRSPETCHQQCKFSKRFAVLSPKRGYIT